MRSSRSSSAFIGAAPWERSSSRQGWRNDSKPRQYATRVGTLTRDLVQRGIEGVEYVVSDEHQGLVQALGLYFPAAEHQRRQVHYARNALAYVSTDSYRKKLTAGLRDAWGAPERAEAEARLVRLSDRFRTTVPQLAEWLDETAEQTLACFTIGDPHARKRLRSTNSVEHDHAEVRRRTRVVRIFPNDASLVRLSTASPSIATSSGWNEDT